MVAPFLLRHPVFSTICQSTVNAAHSDLNFLQMCENFGGNFELRNVHLDWFGRTTLYEFRIAT